MNDNERQLIWSLAHNDPDKAKAYARVIVSGITSQKDAHFKDTMLSLLKEEHPIDLPPAVNGLLIAENSSDFKKDLYYVKQDDIQSVEKMLALYKASDKLLEIGIQYYPGLILYGESGCGKTELARYIAYRAGIPFLCVNLSQLLASYLGQTQQNLGKIFAFIHSGIHCVLCFDELDAIGMTRGQKEDVGEMNRIVIALMQELDRCPGNVIIVGTTNRYDMLDPALKRRFQLEHEIKPLSFYEAVEMASLYFKKAGMTDGNAVAAWSGDVFGGMSDIKASTVAKLCTDEIVNHIVSAMDADNNV